jgi:uncharacterized protein HemX
VETRWEKGGGTEPFATAEGLPAPLSPQEATAQAERRVPARSAHGLLRFAAITLAVLGVTGLLTSALTYRAGLAWRNRAKTEVIHTQQLASRLGDAQAQVAAAARALSQANEQLAVRTRQLQRSEADVAQLERRLQALGTEKARVEDEREAVRDDRDRLVEIAGLAARVGQDVDTCVTGLSDWLKSRPSPLGVTQPALWAAWAGSGDSVAANCANARISNEQLEMAVND